MPYDYHASSVVNGNMHTLQLTTPLVRDGGTVDYNQLQNKPTINGVELAGDLSLENLGIQHAGDYATEPLSEEELEELIRE